MSKQTGLIRLDGKIGGISFYKLDGEDLARIANGPSKEKILKDPAFIRTRENNVEFGGSATVAKAFRLSLANVILTMADARLASRLTKLFKEINLRGTGTRGQRPILLTSNEVLLLNFELNERHSLGSVFNAPFTRTNTPDRDQGDIVIASFIPDSFIDAPAGATHFRVVQALGVVSDYAYDPATTKYEPLDATTNMFGAVTYSPVLALGSAPVSATLTSALAGSPTMTGDVSVLQCLGIEFFQRVGSTDYLLAQGNAMKIINVF